MNGRWNLNLSRRSMWKSALIEHLSRDLLICSGLLVLHHKVDVFDKLMELLLVNEALTLVDQDVGTLGLNSSL